MNEDILLNVLKPGRYIGGEWNVAKKDFANCKVKFALCFPDLYEIGMSNLGLRIIYSILNILRDVSCERFFAPSQDIEAILRSRGKELFSLENHRSLKEFDLVGFSLGHELCYTNVLNMLELGAIPLQANRRDHTYPLVIAGGPTVLNPEPIHEFFDFFVIGEAEEVILEIVDAYRSYQDKFKSGQISKQELLKIFSNITGVYVPSLYEVGYSEDGKIADFKPKVEGAPRKIKKRFIQDLENARFPVDWLVPYIQIVHDRITLEIMRGCPNQCRFCQARSQYYPWRKRSIATITKLALQTYDRTGYEEVSLTGLSVSDYPQIEELVERLINLFKANCVSISLPSIKPKTLIGNLSSLIASIKKTGLTFAPEAATGSLRQVLNKNFDVANFLEVLRESYSYGYQRVKLYFMIGLPYETQDDLDGILELATQVSQIRRKTGRGPAQVNLSINALIPKPHTPFQWFKMEDLAVIQAKQEYLKKKIRNKRLELRFHNSQMSFLEGVLSRGDRRLAEVILRAFQKGARFDAWENYFVFNKWMEAFEESGIDPEFYLGARSIDEILPWDFLDIGVAKSQLLADFNNILPLNKISDII